MVKDFYKMMIQVPFLSIYKVQLYEVLGWILPLLWGLGMKHVSTKMKLARIKMWLTWKRARITMWLNWSRARITMWLTWSRARITMWLTWSRAIFEALCPLFVGFQITELKINLSGWFPWLCLKAGYNTGSKPYSSTSGAFTPFWYICYISKLKCKIVILGKFLLPQYTSNAKLIKWLLYCDIIKKFDVAIKYL